MSHSKLPSYNDLKPPSLNLLLILILGLLPITTSFPLPFPVHPKSSPSNDPTLFTPIYTCSSLPGPHPLSHDVHLAAIAFALSPPSGEYCTQNNSFYMHWGWACLNLYTLASASIGICGPPGASLKCQDVAGMADGISRYCAGHMGDKTGNEAGGYVTWGNNGRRVVVHRRKRFD